MRKNYESQLRRGLVAIAARISSRSWTEREALTRFLVMTHRIVSIFNIVPPATQAIAPPNPLSLQ